MSVISEEALTSKDRKELDDSMYGIVYTDENGKKVRKYPLNDEAHVLQAVRFFNKAEAKYKPHLARKIVARAKELKMDWEKWDVLKPYLDKPVKEQYMTYEWLMKQNYPDPDSTSGTSDFDDSDKEPDDCYTESFEEMFGPVIQESDTWEIDDEYDWMTTKLDNEVCFDLTTCNNYWKMVPKKIFTDAKFGIDISSDVPDNWELSTATPGIWKDLLDETAHYTHSIEYTINEFDHLDDKRKSIHEGTPFNHDEVLTFVKDVRNNVLELSHSHIFDIKNSEYIMNENDMKVINEIHDLGERFCLFAIEWVSKYKPTRLRYFNEAFDAVTGEEIPINHAYTMDEMKERTFSAKDVDDIRSHELRRIKKPDTDEVYFGSPTKYDSIKLDRPLFVTPYKSIASIFIWRDWGLQNRIPRGSYNHNYEEFINFDKSKAGKPLKDVHVYVEGAPFIEPFTVEQEGYIHCIKVKDYENDFYTQPWMATGMEYNIANVDEVKVTRVIKVKVRYHVVGKPTPNGKHYGPSKGGILQYTHDIADKIHTKYEADQKEPTGNQNCLLCAWCAEAQMRGQDCLPRPIYSPRDSALEIVPGDIVGGVTKRNPGNFYDMLEHLRGDSIKQPFARWYCHVKWGHSNGGHEFLIVKIDEDAFNIMDPQQGIVRPLTADDSYMKNVDWEGVYICRIDDKPFKYMKFNSINDPTKTLPWDPKKDIPYMLREGLITKEEAETELRREETNLFTSELKKALGQTPIQEGLFFKKKEYPPLEISDVYQEFVNAYNDPVFKAIISEFKDQRSSLLSKWMNDAHPVDGVFTEEDNDGLVSRFLSKTQVDNFEITNSRYETIGYGFATVRNPDEWLTISKIDGKIYYCDIRPDSIIADSFNEFLSSFGSTFKQYLTKSNKPIQETTLSEGVTESEIYRLTWASILEEFVYLEPGTFKDMSVDFGFSNFEKIPEGPFKVTASENGGAVFSDFYYCDSVPLFSKRLYQKIKTIIQKDVCLRDVEIFSPLANKSEQYKMVLPRRIDCVDRTRSILYPILPNIPNSPLRAEKIVISEKALGDATIFKIAGISDYDIYIRKEIKNILSNSTFDGFDVEPVESISDEKNIQEGAWNDIRNGVNPWSKKRVFHITQQGHLDGQIFKPRVPEYLDKYDPSKDKFEDVDNPRVCFSPSIEGALNAIMVTIGRWKTADKLRDWYVYIPEKPIDQYKHKTTKELVKEKKVYDANVTNEVWIEEPVRLKQYGIIRVDQVSDKHIKKTVPTTTGFQGHRYRYDFKYHWVVKPKVIADVPYDYTPMGVCKDMVDEGYNFKYGLGANGSVHKASPEEYDKNYRLESPEEFEKNGGGICFDFVEWQAGYLEAYGYTCRKFFISTETDDNMTHTFILVDDGNGGFIYPEISFELLQGVHEVKSPEEAIRMIIEKIIEYHKTESIKYYVWEYSDHPSYGSNMDTCLKYFTKGEPFHEGTMNKPEKIK